MAALGVAEADLLERFIHGTGKGGQKINKTSIVVWIKHLPSGMEVRCQESRSQALNRFLARRILAERLEARRHGEASARQQEREKIRRQKRKRSKRAKEKLLAAKKYHSKKKQLRRVHDLSCP
jgi:protein subunit release factor B